MTRMMVVGILCLLVASCVVQAAQTPNVLKDPVISREDRILGLVTTYTMAKQHFAWFDQLPKLDWDAAFKKYLPLVEKEQSLYEYYRILQKFIALLQDSHTSIQAPEAVYKATDVLPWFLNIVEGKWVVIERYPVPEVLAEDIPPGSILLDIEGKSPLDYYQGRFLAYVPSGTERARIGALRFYARYPAGTQVKVKLQYPDGSDHARTLRANLSQVKWNDDLMAKYKLSFHRDPTFLKTDMPGGIVHVRYRSCDSTVEEQFCKLIESFDRYTTPKAIILDIRGNRGGGTPHSAIRHLISKPIPWGLAKTRWSISYYDASFRKQKLSDAQFKEQCEWRGLGPTFDRDWCSIPTDLRIQPHEKHYDGPLYILTNQETASAAEDFVMLLHGTGRATVCGEPTCGETGQPIIADLPGGGKVWVCTMQLKCTDGTEFVHKGYQPAMPLNRTIKGITEGRDELLDALVEHIRVSLKN